MDLQVVSWDGYVFDSGEFVAMLTRVPNELTQADGTPSFVPRPHYAPVYTYKSRGVGTLVLDVLMKCNPLEQIDTLNQWLDTFDDDGLGELLVMDRVTGRQWYVEATPVGQPEVRDALATFTLAVPDPIWKSKTQHSDSWAIAASGATHSITPAGNRDAYPIFRITPTGAKATGFQYRRWVPIYNRAPNNWVLTHYPVDITNGGLATNALVGAGKMQADGDDVRVYVDGLETPRWLQDMNTASTKIWITASWNAGRTMTLAGGIAGAGAVTTITLVATAANKSAISNVPYSGILLIGSEAFSYTGKVISGWTLQFTGCTRAVKDTAMAVHAIGATINWIEHDIWLYYGDATLSAPTTDNTYKPLFALTSTNTSWVYATFRNANGTGSAAWRPSLISSIGKRSCYYTGSHTANVDPATEMGMRIRAWQSGSIWKAEGATLQWYIFIPPGVTTVTASGFKYRGSASWPTATFEVNPGPSVWTVVWTEAAGGLSAWTAWAAHAGVALGATYPCLRFYFTGSVAAAANNEADTECTDITLTLDNTYTPSVTLNAEANNYHLQATITNTLTGDYITVDWVMELNQTLEIDTDLKTATYLHDSANALAALGFSSVRFDWLRLLPGEANTLQFADTGTTGVTFVTLYRDRNA